MPKRGSKKKRKPVGDPNDPDGLAVWMRRYLEALKTKNYSTRTIDNRESYLGFFVEWAADRSITRPAEVTKPILERYQRHLFHMRKPNGKPLSFRAQHSRLVPIRGFFKWLTRSNVILWNPASELDLPKLERRLPRFVLSENDVEKVMMIPDTTDPMGIRDRAILEVLYSTGIRRMEVLNLKLTDIDAERGTLLVRQGKGKKDRMVPIGSRAIGWLDRYIDTVRPGLVVPPDESFVFLTNTGESITPNRLTQLVREYVDRADTGKRGACHLFRHTMATLMLEGGADIRYIQEMLGHVELSTTQIYTQVSIRKLKQVHEATHPGARLDKGQGAEPGPEVEEPEPTVDDLMAALDAEADEEDEPGDEVATEEGGE